MRERVVVGTKPIIQLNSSLLCDSMQVHGVIARTVLAVL